MSTCEAALRLRMIPAETIPHRLTRYWETAQGALFLNSGLAKSFGVSPREVSELRKELERDLWLRARRRTRESAGFDPGPLGLRDSCLYVITRILRPQRVVETGVWIGASSLMFLEGMNKNRRGTLTSVDLPHTRIWYDGDGRRDRAFLPSPALTGIAVPKELRARWDLIQGDSRVLLPRVLSEPVDMFYHDSDHSRDHMLWEFRLAWPAVRPGGWLISDDIERHDAFGTFMSEVPDAAGAFFWFGPRTATRGALRKRN